MVVNSMCDILRTSLFSALKQNTFLHTGILGMSVWISEGPPRWAENEAEKPVYDLSGRILSYRSRK